ncbi:carbon-nitrogen hydrolase family protein [Pararhizobium sp. LjRoot235]|uniref:carbon-nitrogen hydrolase family protein n=1 Tax=Pararhizobium sp. LjRoot235 TaxID=3342291 RepID=UPI003F50B8EF
MKIALIQMNSQPDRPRNLKAAQDLMEQAVAREHPDLIVLPEHFDWTGGTAEDKRLAADHVPGGEAYALVQAFAAKHRVWVHAGSLLEKSPGIERIYNTTVVFDSAGRQVGVYRKIHLFDITAPDGKVYAESATVAPGDQPLIYEINGFRVACAICYDLRFSGLFNRLSAEGVDLFILPAAFTEQTGKDHWEVLCRARAIEFQAYLAACGQCGSYLAPGGEERRTFGHSMICDPWGDVIVRAAGDVTVITAMLDAARLQQVRQWIPMSDHRLELSGVDVRIAE